MLLFLTHWLSHYVRVFHVFQYLTFRSMVSTLTALIIVLFFSPWSIRQLKKLQAQQFVRDDGPESHLKKTGTPTMGGILIIFAISVSVLLWADLTNRFIWVILLVTVLFSVIGFLDDYLKIMKKSSAGLSARHKFLLQSLCGLGAAIFLYLTARSAVETQLLIPFLKNISFNLGLFYLLLSYIVIVGSSNSVNLTDGLDGLALLPTIMIGAALGIFAYLSGNHLFSHYLTIPHIAGVGEVAVFSSALVGAGLGFLWYNTYPAEVFMGDVGSLGLGAALGIIAVVVRQELIYFLMGGIFVAETVSVILQVSYFKLTRGKRLFLMAPLHHHFELKGWAEPKVIVRFWIITFVLVLLGLASLKLR